MAYSDFAPPRRSRRRRNIVILIVLAIIVGVLVLAVRYRTERRESIDYLTVAEEVALVHGDLSEQLATLFQGLSGEDRPDLELRLETFAAEARSAADRLESQVVARPVGEVAGLMAVATDSWADGLEIMGVSIVAILDAEPDDFSADEGLREAFELIRLGDRAYARTLAIVGELDPELVPSPLPEIQYASAQYAPLYNHAIVANRLRLQGGLAEVVDVALIANTFPEPVSESAGGIWTIPASESLALEVNVSNTGNVIVENVKILVTFQKIASSDTFTPLGQLIPSIEPGKSEIRLFENLDVEPGIVYSITATATVDGNEENTDDNVFNLVFERNAE